MEGFFVTMLLAMLILGLMAAYNLSKGDEHDARALKMLEDKLETSGGNGPKQAQVLTIQLEVSRTPGLGHFYWHWVASSRGVPFMQSKEWKDNSRKRTMSEAMVMCMGAVNFGSVRGLTKRQAEFRAKSAPYVWELVRTLEEQGGRAVYKHDGSVESMVRADMQIVNGQIVPMDPEFSLSR